ncbi:MAG TPA: hypothetical protein VJ964_09410 [Balneolaceae bacterium]|nr:hypothetical protein [Balneolaceae bacterium]
MSANATPDKFSYRKLVDLDQQFDQQLKNLIKGRDLPQKESRYSFSVGKILLRLILLLVCLVAPFVVLVRTSIFMYEHYHWNGWLALLTGVIATIILLACYGLYLTLRYGSGAGVLKYMIRGIAILVVSYTLYGLLYYSSMNTKTEDIRSYYRSLHPIMRVTLATITLANQHLVVTDIKRKPEDYAKMGLPENQHSLHYKQHDGYVHAVDLRTKGRAFWKNRSLQEVLQIIGLRTIRHVGTADHLHVYLPLND